MILQYWIRYYRDALVQVPGTDDVIEEVTDIKTVGEAGH